MLLLTWWCSLLEGNVTVSFTPVMSILFSFSELFPWSRCRSIKSSQHIQHWANSTKKIQILNTNTLHMATNPNMCKALLVFKRYLQIFDAWTANWYVQPERLGWEGKQRRREYCFRGLNSMFFEHVLRHYHPLLFLHIWLSSRNVFP